MNLSIGEVAHRLTQGSESLWEERHIHTQAESNDDKVEANVEVVFSVQYRVMRHGLCKFFMMSGCFPDRVEGIHRPQTKSRSSDGAHERVEQVMQICGSGRWLNCAWCEENKICLVPGELGGQG